jgi:hypothetical protein
VPKQGAVDDRALAVASVTDLARIDVEEGGGDPGADLIQDVVPGERPVLDVGTDPPEHTELAEMHEPGPGTLDAREVKLIDLLGGEDPMLVEIDADELISFGE